MMRRSIHFRMRNSRTRLLVLALCAGMALGSSPALAGEGDAPPSAATFKEALAAYDAGRYAEASKLFERVYRETHEPALLFNIAQASRLLGDCQRAVAYYRRFVADAPASADRPRAESWLVELASCEGATTVPPPAEAGEPPPAVAPAPRAAPPPPSVSPAALAPRPAPAPTPLLVVAAPAPSPERARRHSRVPALLAGAGAVVLGSAGTLLAWQAHEDAARVSSLFQTGGVWDDTMIAIDREGHRDQTLSIVCFSAAGALAAAGVVLLVWQAAGGHSESR
jgi:hypothetical protein